MASAERRVAEDKEGTSHAGGRRWPRLAASDGEALEDGEKLSTVEERALEALLSERTFRAAAKKARVPERTLRRWVSKKESFQRAYRDARGELRRQVAARLEQTMATAVGTLESVMRSRSASPAVRIAAARTVLEIGWKNADDETEARIRDLEAKVRECEVLAVHFMEKRGPGGKP
jgi:hypothetical protein